MSIVSFSSLTYGTNCWSTGVRSTQSFVKRNFDLTSCPALETKSKTTFYAILLILAIGLAFNAYLRYSESAPKVIQNPKKLAFFCEKHPEFSGLLQKTLNLVNFEKFGFRNGVNSRDLCIGSDVNKQYKIFIKSPQGKHIFLRRTRAKNEQLAFLISHRLQLGVVPPTIALEGYHDKIETILPEPMLKYAKVGLDPETLEKSYAGVVVQEGVILEENQDDYDRNALDLEQVQKAIIFNLVSGRFDAGPKNTVIAQSGKMMELDNENLGAPLSPLSSWLLSEFAEMTINTEVIENLLSKPAHTIRNVFEEMKDFNFDQQITTNITENFDKIQEFFTLNKKRQVTVKDLVGYLSKS